MQRIPLQGKNKLHRSVALDPSTITNLLPVLDEGGGRTNKAYFMRPGTDEFGTASGTTSRGSLSNASRDEAYIVIDTTLYTQTAAGTRTSRGSVSAMTGTNRVRMAANADNILLTNGVAAYTYIPSTNTLAQVVDADFNNCTSICQFEGYFVYTKPGTRQFYISAVNDGSSYGALDFASKETVSNDLLVGCGSNNRNLYLFGNSGTEIWYLSGDTFPLDKREFTPVGCLNSDSIVTIENSIYFLACTQENRRFIGRIKDYEVEEISMPINSLLATYTTTSDVYSFSLRIDGDILYCISFPTHNKTWAFSLKSQEWVLLTNTAGDYYQAQSSYSLGSKTLIMDRATPKSFEVSNSYLDDDGTDFNWSVVTPTVYSDGVRINNIDLLVDIEAGIGSGGADDPEVTLNVSRDGGYTYGASIARSAGVSADYDKRLKWWRLGQSRMFNYKLSGASGNAWRFLSMAGTFKTGWS